MREEVKEKAEDLGKAAPSAGILDTGKTNVPTILKTKEKDLLGKLARKEAKKEEVKEKERGHTIISIILGTSNPRGREKAKGVIHPLGVDLYRWTLGTLTWEAASKHLLPHHRFNLKENQLKEARYKIYLWELVCGAWVAIILLTRIR